MKKENSKPSSQPNIGKVITHSTSSLKGDPLSIDGVDYIEIYAANALQAAYYYTQAFGFEAIGYRGPETGFREAASYVLRQGKLTFVITSPLTLGSPIAQQLLLHGDTVHDIALKVSNAEVFYNETIKRGAVSAEPITEWSDSAGSIRRAAIRTYGDVIHSIVERTTYTGSFWPGFVPYSELFQPFPSNGPEVGLRAFDHAVGNVELGKMLKWVGFYRDVLGFTEIQGFSDEDISTEYSALMSKVMSDGTGKVKFPINEPATGKRKSQIEEYLDFHVGPGVQHVAMLTGNIIATVSALKDRGVRFLRVPDTYYEELEKRVGTIKEDVKKIAELGILVDRDEDGYLLQIFTQPVHQRPTLFFEIIQRCGSRGFGIGNFKALFESIELEQARRGNL